MRSHFAVLILVASIFAGVVSADEKEQPLQFPLKEIWRYQVSEHEITAGQLAMFTTPCMDDLRVFYASANGTCGALFKRTGEVSWIFNSNEPLTYGLLLFENGPIVTASSGRIYALDRESGLVIWHRILDPGLSTAICSARAGVLLSLSDGSVQMLDPQSGSQRWVFSAAAPVTSPLLDEEDRVFFGDNVGNIYCLNGADGKENWRFTAGGAIHSGIALKDKSLFFGSDDNFFYSLNSDEGTLRWRARTAGDVNGYPVCSDKTVFIAASDRTLRAFRFSNGHARVGSPVLLSANIEVPLLLAGSQILFPRKKDLVAVNAETLKETAKYTAPDDITTGVLWDRVDGVLYFGCRDGSFVASAPEVIANRQVSLQAAPPIEREIKRSAGIEAIRPEVKKEAESPKPDEKTEKAVENKVTEETTETKPEQVPPEEPAKETDVPAELPAEEPPTTVNVKPEASEPAVETVETKHSSEEMLALAIEATKAGDLDRASKLWRETLADKASTTYTVTIGMFCRREAVLSLISRLGGSDVLIFDRVHGGQTCYFVCIGWFGTREEAEKYMEGLGENIKKQNPAAYRLDSFITPVEN
jgi:outer membrane protein assembly factor BamB